MTGRTAPLAGTTVRWLSRIGVALALAVIAGVGVVLGGLAAGYRPVIIQTGSMAPSAPAGTLAIAAPRDPASVEPGQILVMRRPGSAVVTHRIIEIERAEQARFAITQGDANEAPDATPYPLDDTALVVRWTFPGLGPLVAAVFRPGIALAIVLAATAVNTLWALRRIWSAPAPSRPRSGPRAVGTGRGRWRRRAVLASSPLVAVTSVGVAWALFSSSEAVDSNVFGVVDCFDAQLGSVQSGENIHAVDGTVTVPITAVDEAKAFVVASVRSGADEPADATVEARLATGGGGVELVRATDATTPDPVTVAWSVIEYDCGVSVQRGVTAGNGTNQIDVAVTTADPGASFAIVSSAPARTDSAFDGDDLVTTQLTSPTNLSITAAPGTVLDPQRSFAWQVVTFADSGDVAVQTASATLGSGQLTEAIALASPADPDTTFLLTSVRSAGAGADIGERMVRAHLSDANTVTVSRAVVGSDVDIVVQVVTLKDGSTVRHGTVDLATTDGVATVDLDPIDPARSTALATVAVPGLTAGGQTDHVLDDVPGEGAATFAVTDATTVTISRQATASNASFGWQVIEWAGPRWWDGDYVFRQRIDVDTTTEAAPDGYTVPVTLDHAALVTLGLSEADGSDVRVAAWDGTSWTELDRVLDDAASWDHTATTLRFRTTVPIPAASTISYWLYFGNDSAGPPPADPENVYLLVEDFESGTLGDFEDRTGGTAWYSAAPWTRRIPLSVPAAGVTTTLTQFPLLVSIVEADLGTNAQTDGSDIRFTAGDGSTPLAHEIEAWDPATGTLEAWVLVPGLSASADTDLYLYYGAGDAPAQHDPGSLWGSDLAAVWHLARDPGGSAPLIDDSSDRNRDGLTLGGLGAGNRVAGVTGAAGSAVTFDGIDDRGELGSFPIGPAGAFTVDGWVKPGSVSADATILARGSSPSFELRVEPGGPGTLTVRARVTIGGSMVEATGSVADDGQWHHLAVTYDGAAVTVVVDGVAQTPVAATGPVTDSGAPPVAIAALPGGAAPFPGALDEIRVSTVARTTAWLATQHANHTAAGFVTEGPIEVGSWFGGGTWSYRKPIAVDAGVTTVDLVDFPLLVRITDAELAASAAADGSDLVFTAADGSTRLDHVIESWESATGELSAWVSVPLIDAADGADLFLYYGNGSAVDQQDPIAVFGPDADLALLGNR